MVLEKLKNKLPDSYFEHSVSIFLTAMLHDQSVSLFPAGIRKTFRVDVQPTPFAPFDLYFLMDLSQSLATDLATIRDLTSDIGKLVVFGNINW